MTPAHVVQITTPKKYLLNGLWFGPKKPRQVVVWVHGLGSSMFSKLEIARLISDKNIGVLAFNNRGNGTVTRIPRKGKESTRGGAAFEVFTDCIDDIQGAINFARRAASVNIFLAGHSTGCQKSVYWASKKGKGVKGVILLAPVSDYAAMRKKSGAVKLLRVANYARRLVRRGRPHELIPSSIWSTELDDAQRFLSLYTQDSVEEIFTYAQPKKKPTTLQKVRIPTLVLWAEKDEFSDRPAKEIAAWFEKNLKNRHKVVVVPKVGHSFRGGERRVARDVRQWMRVQK